MQQSGSLLQQPASPAVPRTRAELDALHALRGELNSQLNSVTGQRRTLADQHRNASSRAEANAIQARMNELDARSGRLERQLMQVDDAIAAGVAGVITNEPQTQTSISVPPPPPPPDVSNQVARIALLEGIAFVLIGFVFWRFAFKRALARIAHPVDQSARLDQLQQAVDVIAVEVERISEGQRYVTKVLNEKLQPALGAGEAQQIPASRKDAVSIRESDGSA